MLAVVLDGVVGPPTESPVRGLHLSVGKQEPEEFPMDFRPRLREGESNDLYGKAPKVNRLSSTLVDRWIHHNSINPHIKLSGITGPREICVNLSQVLGAEHFISIVICGCHRPDIFAFNDAGPAIAADSDVGVQIADEVLLLGAPA